ncbi:facilitated trehalose transporter Tret1-2 homolog [Rhopalosiphum maidis]|uniref:facilitated trehalose transporter Tret1-2 homolog n=1 Tax=Rhopalosiphum maidis TaxID=43146 RepID=UPI000F008830|nr:facilitated trehalose transporter Tret1-2 homolog [Rhopalosiphum maidis]
MGLWAGWPSWALTKRPEADTPAEWLSRDDHSWAVASFDLANLVSAWPASLLAERAGRKGCLLTVGAGLVASFAVLYAPSRWAVFAGRSLAGVCKSVAYASVPGFMAEISADRARGRFNLVVVLSDSLGMLVALSVGPRVRYAVMNGLSLAVGLAFLVAVVRVPETPHYLLSKSRLDDARSALRWYRPRSTTVDNNRRLNQITLAVRDDMREPGTYRELFTDDGNRVAVLLVAGACFAQRAGGVGCVLAYSTTTMPANGPVHPGDVAVVFAVVRLACSVAAVPLIDVYGRRPLLIGSHLALAAVTAAYALCLLYVDDRPDNWGPSVCVVLFSVAYSMGAGIVPGALVGEMFPANVKSRAVTVVAVVSSLGSFVINKAYLPVSDAFGVYVMFFVFCAVNATWTVLAYQFLFETKGMSLSAIQDHLDDYNSSSSEDEDGNKLPLG